MATFEGYILSKSKDEPVLSRGVFEGEPMSISAKGWAVDYGAMRQMLPHLAGPEEFLLPVRIFENGDLEITDPKAGSDGNEARRFTGREVYALNDQEFPYPAAAFAPGEYDMKMTATITDMEEFCDTFMEDGDRLSVGVNFTKTMFPPCAKNLPAGVTGAQFRISGTNIDMTLNVRIDDPDLFLMITCHGGRASGRDHDYVPENLGDAIFEAFLGASDTPTPIDCGFEIRDWSGEPTQITHDQSEDAEMRP